MYWHQLYFQINKDQHKVLKSPEDYITSHMWCTWFCKIAWQACSFDLEWLHTNAQGQKDTAAYSLLAQWLDDLALRIRQVNSFHFLQSRKNWLPRTIADSERLELTPSELSMIAVLWHLPANTAVIWQCTIGQQDLWSDDWDAILLWGKFLVRLRVRNLDEKYLISLVSRTWQYLWTLSYACGLWYMSPG